jgi:hypothetical protein
MQGKGAATSQLNRSTDSGTSPVRSLRLSRAILQVCISAMQEESTTESQHFVRLYRHYPVPSAREWKDIISRVAKKGNVSDAFDCMAEYEQSLRSRGLQTVLGEIVDRLRQEAREAGIPDEFFPDMVMLSELMNKTQ